MSRSRRARALSTTTIAGFGKRPADQARQLGQHCGPERLAVGGVARVVAHYRTAVGDPDGGGRAQLEHQLLERERALRHGVAGCVEVQPPLDLVRSDALVELVTKPPGLHDAPQEVPRGGEQEQRDDHGGGAGGDGGRRPIAADRQPRPTDRQRGGHRPQEIRAAGLERLAGEPVDGAQLGDARAEGDQRGDRLRVSPSAENTVGQLGALRVRDDRDLCARLALQPRKVAFHP